MRALLRPSSPRVRHCHFVVGDLEPRRQRRLRRARGSRQEPGILRPAKRPGREGLRGSRHPNRPAGVAAARSASGSWLVRGVHRLRARGAARRGLADAEEAHLSECASASAPEYAAELEPDVRTHALIAGASRAEQMARNARKRAMYVSRASASAGRTRHVRAQSSAERSSRAANSAQTRRTLQKEAGGRCEAISKRHSSGRSASLAIGPARPSLMHGITRAPQTRPPWHLDAQEIHPSTWFLK